jgi:hypothetical protein
MPALGPRNDHSDAPAAAFGVDQPRMPIRDARLGTVARGHLDRIGLDLMMAIEAPNDQPDVRRRGVAERHRRAGL